MNADVADVNDSKPDLAERYPELNKYTALRDILKLDARAISEQFSRRVASLLLRIQCGTVQPSELAGIAWELNRACEEERRIEKWAASTEARIDEALNVTNTLEKMQLLNALQNILSELN